MEDRQEAHPNQRELVLTLTAAAAETIFSAILLLRIPADAKNAFLFGLSKERLLMLAAFGLIFILNIFLLFRKDRLYEKCFSKPAFSRMTQLLTLITLFFVLLPAYRFDRGAAYYVRIRPFLIWAFLTSLTFRIFCRYDEDRFAVLREIAANLALCKKTILICLAILTAGVIFVEFTGLGKTAETALWNKNGIPLQSIQLFFSILIFGIASKAGLFRFLQRHKKIFHFFFIWAISAAVWSLAPLSDHFFAPGPYEPNFEYYPYSDAAGYDIAAQTALNGWQFNLGWIILKPTLVFTTLLTHLITGNDTNQSMMVQSALFAILPAIIFLFGSAIAGTGCGYLAAAFSLLREWNALNTHTVLTINSRLTMSEFLMQILFAVFCYAMFRWLQKNGDEPFYAILSGGTLTLGICTRYNFLAFLPAALLMLLIGYRSQLRRLCKPLFFFCLSIVLTGLPLIYRDSQKNWILFHEFSYTFNEILLKNRYSDDFSNISENKENLSEETAEKRSDSPVLRVFAQIDPDYDENSNVPEITEEKINTSQITEKFQNNNSALKMTIIESIINHGIHNFIASSLTLPLQLSFDDLEHLYTQDEGGLWRDDWKGNFSPLQWIYILIWILAGAAAIGKLISLFGPAGFSLPYFWLVYCFSIGISRSSGGRYVVPCGWIPMLLLAFFITLLFGKGKITIPEVSYESQTTYLKTILTQAAFLCFFTAMVAFEKFQPAKITAAPEGDIQILQERLSDIEGIDWDLIRSQSKSGQLHITHGTVLYPRFYYFGQGEHAANGAAMKKDYSRMIFTGINKEESGDLMWGYLMPYQELIPSFPQDSVFRAISCTSPYGYEDVLAVTLETPEGEIYTYVRDPLPAFSCPLPEPVCIEIGKCR